MDATVIESGRRALAIEVKAGSQFRERDLSGLHAFLAKVRGASLGILAYNGSETVALADRLWAVPLARLLS